MKRIFIHGIGCVSPAGWGVAALRDSLADGAALPVAPAQRPGSKRPLSCHVVPPWKEPPSFRRHPRLRRVSSLTVFAAAAALEALGREGPAPDRRLGLVFCVTGGCVQFTRRFGDEAWRNPSTASPLVFPETVFNAPASHLGALLNSPAVNYTCVGDPSAVLQGFAIAADWLEQGLADDCLVIGAEENDWLTLDAHRHFSRRTVCAEGAGAIVLSTTPSQVELKLITDATLYLSDAERAAAVRAVRAALPSGGDNALLCDSQSGWAKRDGAEAQAWADWRGARLSPKKTLGEGLSAAAAWQCVAALDWLWEGRGESAVVSVAGMHEHAIGAQFSRAPT